MLADFVKKTKSWCSPDEAAASRGKWGGCSATRIASLFPNQFREAAFASDANDTRRHPREGSLDPSVECDARLSEVQPADASENRYVVRWDQSPDLPQVRGDVGVMNKKVYTPRMKERYRTWSSRG